MYKVKDKNPDVIARFVSEPILDSHEFGFTPDSKLIKKKLDTAEKFLCNPHADPLKKVERVYKLVDWLIEHLGVYEKSVCQKGCAHCCALDVDVSIMEALYIADKMDLTVVDRDSRTNMGYHKSKDYCPFLDKQTATCSIREFRPLNCRLFFTMDNPLFCELTENLKKHAIFTADSSPIFKHFTLSFQYISNNKNADIREWFKEYTRIPYSDEYTKSLKFDVNK